MNATLAPGDRFVVVRKLGTGSMGEVRLARDIEQDRLVALKNVGLSDNDAMSQHKLWREGQTLKLLDHPGIVKCLGMLKVNDRYVMVQEFVEGITFRRWFNWVLSVQDGRYDFNSLLRELPAEESKDEISWLEHESGEDEFLPPDAEDVAAASIPPEARRYCESKEHIDRCCEMVRQAAAALGHAHERDVVHRDLKPENLMIDRNGKACIIDFGVARYQDATTMSQSRAVLGSPIYMSPEHITGRINVNDRSDVFSLGIVLYEALTLRCPYSAPTILSLFRQIVTMPMPPLRRLNPGVQWELEAIVHKAITKDPEARYANAGLFEQDLARYLAGQPVSARPYRYKPDHREIAGERPVSVTIAGLLFYFLACIFFLAILAFFTMPSTPSSEKIAPLARYLTTGIFAGFGIVSFGTGRGLLHANRVALVMAPLAASIVALASLKYISDCYYDINNTMFSIIMYSLFICICLFIITAVLSQKTRKWYHIAQNIRSEQDRSQRS
jgi:serine/threonine protein kinase